MKTGLFWGFFLAALPAAAFQGSPHDKIILHDGTVIEGEIKIDNPKEEFMWILPKGGTIKTPVRRKDIKTIIRRKTGEQAYKEESARINPGDAEERMRLARECISKRMYPSAGDELYKLLTETRGYWEAMLLLSEMEMILGSAEDAYRHALMACQSQPRSADTQAQAGKAAAAAGQHEKAVAHFDISIGVDDRPETHVWRGISLAELGRLDDAERDLRGALDANPDSVYANLGIGRLALAKCSLVEAVASLKEAAKLIEKAALPRSETSRLRAEIYRALGSAHYLAGEFSEADEALRIALNEEPNSPASFTTLGLCGILAGAGKRGIRDLRLANEKSESAGRAHIGLAYILDVRGELLLALDEYDKAVSASPRDAYCWYMRGNANYRAAGSSADEEEAKSHFHTALSSFSKAAALAPVFVDAVRGAGAAALAVSEVEDASRWFDKASELAPNAPDVQAGLGLVHLARGELQEAESLLKAVLQAHPANAQAMLGLGYIANANARDLEAEQFFLSALADRSAASYAVSALGKLCEARKLEFIHLNFNAPPLPGGWTVLARFGIPVGLEDGKLGFSGTQARMRGGRTAFLHPVTSAGFVRVECKVEVLAENFEGGLFLEGPGGEVACGE